MGRMAASTLIMAVFCATVVQVNGQCERCGFLGLGELSVRNSLLVLLLRRRKLATHLFVCLAVGLRVVGAPLIRFHC